MIAGLPTGAVLMLNTHRVRAIGPIVFAAMLFLFCCILGGQIFGALYILDVIGPIHFVRDDLARLPIVAAGEQYLGELLSLPMADLLEAIKALGADPWRTIRADHIERLTTRDQLYFIGVSFITTALGAAASWVFVRWLAFRYRTRRASDQMLAIDVLMVIFTLSLF